MMKMISILANFNLNLVSLMEIKEDFMIVDMVMEVKDNHRP